MSRKHHIQKQILDFEFSSKSAAIQWQRNVSFKYQHEFEKKMNAVLDRFDDGTYHYIERIELDLGMLSEESVAVHLAKALEKSLKKKLTSSHLIPEQKRILSDPKETVEAPISNEKGNLLHLFQAFLMQGSFPWNAEVSSVLILEEKLLHTQSISNLVVQMKSTGILKNLWARQRLYYQFSESFSRPVIQEYFQKEWRVLKVHLDLFEAQLFPFLLSAGVTIADRQTEQTKGETSILKWITIHSSSQPKFWPKEFVKSYVNQLSAQGIFKKVPKLEVSLMAIKIEGQSLKEIDMAIFKALSNSQKFLPMKKQAPKPNRESKLALTDTPERLASKDKIKQDSLKRGKEVVLKDQIVSQRSWLKDKGVQKEKKDSTEAPTKEQKEKSLNTANTTEHSKSLKPKENKAASSDSKNKRGQTTNPKPLREFPGLSKQDSEEISESLGEHQVNFKEEFIEEEKEVMPIIVDLKDGIDDVLPIKNEDGKGIELASQTSYYTTYSGLILTWPYLSRLFENLGFLQDQKFKSKEQQERAVLLLGYIASGMPLNEEPQLVLAKLLCDWPLQMPIRKEVELSQKELDEANGMLQGLISNWTILKNTSIEGLRETFFNREGKLVDEEDHWKLIVEQRGTDMLLGQLPYGRSIIMLPWLQKLLKVDWS